MKIQFVLLLLASLLLLSKPAAASCAVKSSVEKEAKEASVIFVGTVTKISASKIASAGYPLGGKKIVWEKYFHNTDVVTFTIQEAFKGISSETIEIATSADGDAGYKFDGGTWLDVGKSYLVYAYKIRPAGTVDDDLTEENYGEAAVELRKIQKSLPKKLADEINEFNTRIPQLSAGICGRTTHVDNAKDEMEQIRMLFSKASSLVIEPPPSYFLVRHDPSFIFD